MYVAEFTLHVKPGHFTDVAELYSAFAADFLATHEALESVLVVGDEASGLVRGIGVWADRESADSVNSRSRVRDVQRHHRAVAGCARGARRALVAAPVRGGSPAVCFWRVRRAS